VGWQAAQQNQPAQSGQGVLMIHTMLHTNEQCFPSVLIDDIQQSKWRLIVCPVVHEIVASDMVGNQQPEPDSRAISQPQTTSLGLLSRHLQPFTTSGKNI
jgi:hypothetical protein